MDLIFWIMLIVALLLVVFVPRFGLLARYRDYREALKRERVEDALKTLLDGELERRHASPDSIASALGLTRPRLQRLVEQMESQGLLEAQRGELHLTARGERWAMQVVRAHRLWERYLADEARMPLGKIHGEAHRREHRLSQAQVDELDAALGHPTYDPHGDPIPTRQGTLPKTENEPLSTWQVDQPGRIAHLEDEPALAYQQILAEGLRLGQQVWILERTPERLVLSDGENEYRLAPAVAANVHLAALPESERLKRQSIPLTELPHEARAEIVMLDDAVQGFTRRRFLDLGLTPGSIIYPELENFFGDPRAYRLRGTLIALRKDQAAQIWVRPV